MFDGTPLQQLSGEWKMSAPLIHDGKVVFTAPDGGAIHCLSLKDGNFLWQAERKDDLYIAGIFQGKVVLVGKNTLPGPEPGRRQDQTLGSRNGHAVGAGRRQRHISITCRCAKAKSARSIWSMASSRPTVLRPRTRVPGNLLFYQGDVISQNETTITAYPQVEQKVAQIDATLAKNAKDPSALTERGELRLYKGDLAGAVADLARCHGTQSAAGRAWPRRAPSSTRL